MAKNSSLGGFEPPTFRLTAERASRLRHRDLLVFRKNSQPISKCIKNKGLQWLGHVLRMKETRIPKSEGKRST